MAFSNKKNWISIIYNRQIKKNIHWAWLILSIVANLNERWSHRILQIKSPLQLS